MKSSGIHILVLFLNFLLYCGASTAQISQKSTIKTSDNSNQAFFITNNPPVAVNDTFVLCTGCGRNSITGNIFLNDYDPDGNKLELIFIVTPKIGEFFIDDNGQFLYTIPYDFLGTIKLEYYITDISESNFKADAEVSIFVKPDYDCDNLSDEVDLDNDNDGILNIDEGNGCVDTDADGIPDSKDIDSDNDGITDNEEWQREGYFIAPKETDLNKNGWDDAYDNLDSIKGIYYHPIDSNNDGVPDFIDNNSDDDEIPDYIEGYDTNHDGVPDISILNCDTDKDGLDDAFDVTSCWSEANNPVGCNSPLPDLNKNGIRDWRETENYTTEEEKKLIAQLIILYPNPSKGVFSINIPNSDTQDEIKLLLFSASGNLELEKTITAESNTINIENYSSGVYIVQLHFDTFILSEKLIIKK